MLFRDRVDAGRRLATELVGLGLSDPVVLALPRGGVPVALPVASALGGSVDVLVARKVGAPASPEYGIGAVAEGGGVVADVEAIRAVGVDEAEWDRLVEAERAEVQRRVQAYRAGRALPALAGRDVVVVDDGLATGVTAEAALRSVRAQSPRRLVLAAPVCACAAAERLRSSADDVVCASVPEGFRAVGQFYERFEQTSDGEVVELLGRHAGAPG